MMFAIIVQYAVLGKRIQVLMKNNLSMTLACERLMENAATVMKVSNTDRPEGLFAV